MEPPAATSTVFTVRLGSLVFSFGWAAIGGVGGVLLVLAEIRRWLAATKGYTGLPWASLWAVGMMLWAHATHSWPVKVQILKHELRRAFGDGPNADLWVLVKFTPRLGKKPELGRLFLTGEDGAETEIEQEPAPPPPHDTRLRRWVIGRQMAGPFRQELRFRLWFDRAVCRRVRLNIDAEGELCRSGWIDVSGEVSNAS